MPFIIGLTGGIGSGKSSAAKIFRELGAGVIDTDEVAHRLTAAGQPATAEIREQFGAEYLQPDGALDRARMRALVFSDSAARRKLEAILHPRIRAEVTALASGAVAPYVVAVVPLLVETGAYRGLVQRVLVVDCDEATQVARALQRGGIAEHEVRAIIAAQAGRTARLAHADDVVRNDRDPAALREQLVVLHWRYLELARSAAVSGNRG
ncbi:MAG TPA: dephospho-CoA kinase [Burkholderiales bacterium]|nr:dephospho-CoA kinase [Burkholderiales bacterium]